MIWAVGILHVYEIEIYAFKYLGDSDIEMVQEEIIDKIFYSSDRKLFVVAARGLNN